MCCRNMNITWPYLRPRVCKELKLDSHELSILFYEIFDFFELISGLYIFSDFSFMYGIL